LRFLYAREAQRGVSNHLHWPGGSSGVTLGPGYDMGGRTAAEIARDLMAVGVAADRAKVIGDGAAGLTGLKARDYAHAFKRLADLSEDQQMQLLRKVVPDYEGDVKSLVKVDIFQYQFDALVSFDYNCGTKYTKQVYRYINDGKVAAAMDEMRKHNKSGGVVNSDLTKRRELEIAVYLYAKYRS
jgi:GH24 family phage-related lysozyme (muramidase)